MAYFNTTALKQNIQTGIPISAYNSNDYDNRLDSIRVLNGSHSSVSSLGETNQGYVDLFRQLSHKYPGYIGWRVSSVTNQGVTISKTIPHLFFYSILKPQVTAGILTVLGPWVKRYARDEDLIAIAFGMSSFGVNEATNQNILGSNAAFLTGIGGYLLDNRSQISI